MVTLLVACSAAEPGELSGGPQLHALPNAWLIPHPTSVERTDGTFVLRRDAVVSGLGAAHQLSSSVAGRLSEAAGFPILVAPKDASSVTDTRAGIRLELVDDESDPESYALTIAEDGIHLQASAPAGLFYGTQTLAQLVPDRQLSVTSSARSETAVALPLMTIQDAPRFPWRGVMLDVARHFFSVDTVKRVIDAAATYKLNRVHLHLTDDQGWRIEIESWPELTRVGGKSAVGGGAGGYFTQDDYREIVAYAAERFVTVVPEIDMPGHTNAALASYAELNESGQAPEPYTGTLVGFSSLWLESEITARFVQDVIREVSEMTPGKFLHIGGDEARATDPEAYGRFIKQVQGWVNEQEKVLVGWEEISRSDLSPPFIAQHWEKPELALKAANQGGDIIASPATHAYLDMRYQADSRIGHFWAGFIDVQKAYNWDPTDALEGASILGVEAPLWTEFVETDEDIDYLMFPRLPGYAEIGWSPRAGRSWSEYRERLAHHASQLSRLGPGYYQSPEVDWAAVEAP